MKQGSVSERIAKMVDYYHKGNKSAFAKAASISNQSLGEIVGARQSAPSFAALQKILAAFPEVRMEWLVIGQGSMLKSDTQPITVGNLPLRPITVQYTDNFYRDRLPKGKTPFETYERDLPSESALQEFADHFGTTIESLGASLPPRKQKESVRQEVPAFISQLKEWDVLTISLEQHAAHIKQATEQMAHAAKATKGYACFEVTAGNWLACQLLNSSMDAIPDSLCTVVTRSDIFAAHVRPGSSKSLGDMQVYSQGGPPDYLLAEDILQVWACEMLLTSQI